MKIHLVAAALTSAVLAAPASAQFYAGLGVGASSISGSNGSTTVSGVPVSGTGGDTTKTAWKIYGGYKFAESLRLEGQYSDLGNRSYALALGAPANLSGSATLRADQWSLAAVGTVPLSNGFSLFGKFGASRNHIGGGNLSLGGINVNVGGSDRTDLLLGAGIGYDINKNIGVRLEYENFGRLSSNGSLSGASIRADLWSASLKYGF